MKAEPLDVKLDMSGEFTTCKFAEKWFGGKSRSECNFEKRIFKTRGCKLDSQLPGYDEFRG